MIWRIIWKIKKNILKIKKEGDAQMIAEHVTENIAKHVEETSVNLSELSRKSGVAYVSLYTSLADKKKSRELRADELVSICKVLRINPMDFADEPKKEVV